MKFNSFFRSLSDILDEVSASRVRATLELRRMNWGLEVASTIAVKDAISHHDPRRNLPLQINSIQVSGRIKRKSMRGCAKLIMTIFQRGKPPAETDAASATLLVPRPNNHDEQKLDTDVIIVVTQFSVRGQK
jgi:hypothetical protein